MNVPQLELAQPFPHFPLWRHPGRSRTHVKLRETNALRSVASASYMKGLLVGITRADAESATFSRPQLSSHGHWSRRVQSKPTPPLLRTRKAPNRAKRDRLGSLGLTAWQQAATRNAEGGTDARTINRKFTLVRGDQVVPWQALLSQSFRNREQFFPSNLELQLQ